ncbi:MAG: hypothetical protein IPI67_35775 [Myxococcales bacterium]|nr:hypothetical protein [Myxococcales bacterium]
MATDIDDALSQCLADECHRLRCAPYGELERLVDAPSKWTRPFRSRTVGLAAIATRLPDENLALVVRAFVLPEFLTRHIAFDAFTKLKDDSWSKTVPPEAHEYLRSKLALLVPPV